MSPTRNCRVPKRRRYFVTPDRGEDVIEATPKLRKLMQFKQHNLQGAWPMRGPFDVIFCRNVVIYFDAVTQARLYRRFADAMAPSGHLFIGHSERIPPAAIDGFEAVGGTDYRRRATPRRDPVFREERTT